MKLNSNTTNNIKTSKEKSKIFNFENINNNKTNNNQKIKFENQNSSFNNSIKNIWSQLNEKKSILI